ncbi:MAG: hypothetical protein EOO77_27280 [Oxalobacteraceae bacterium]|nr:MAG: hypothetical protein EOO77_27280 [Oxalobacteraceae bacterium]
MAAAVARGPQLAVEVAHSAALSAQPPSAASRLSKDEWSLVLRALPFTDALSCLGVSWVTYQAACMPVAWMDKSLLVVQGSDAPEQAAQHGVEHHKSIAFARSQLTDDVAQVATSTGQRAMPWAVTLQLLRESSTHIPAGCTERGFVRALLSADWTEEHTRSVLWERFSNDYITNTARHMIAAEKLVLQEDPALELLDPIDAQSRHPFVGQRLVGCSDGTWWHTRNGSPELGQHDAELRRKQMDAYRTWWLATHATHIRLDHNRCCAVDALPLKTPMGAARAAAGIHCSWIVPVRAL